MEKAIDWLIKVGKVAIIIIAVGFWIAGFYAFYQHWLPS